MSLRFYSEPATSRDLCSEIGSLAPANPFYSWPYIEARRSLGSRPWILKWYEGDRILSGCSAFMTEGRVTRRLEITSLPEMPNKTFFWERLLEFCRTMHVSHLDLNTYGSASASIPSIPGELSRIARWEHVIDLSGSDLWENIHYNHRRAIKRAQRAQVEVHRTRSASACQQHARLIAASMKRRSERGEEVPLKVDTDAYVALVHHGAGELFQAIIGGRVLSSMLILETERGIYLQSAGTDTEGMACGASHFLVYEIAGTVRNASVATFNLGGTDDPDSGLASFKSRFGSRLISLESTAHSFRSWFALRLIDTARFFLDQVTVVQ